MALYQLFRLDPDNGREKWAEVNADSDGEAIGHALRRTENGGKYSLRRQDREIAEIEVNDNSFLLSDRSRATAAGPTASRVFGLLAISALVAGLLFAVVQ